MLHTCRRFEYCRDVIMLVSESTSADYLDHLRERNYRFITAGSEKVDLRIALELLYDQFNIHKILTDTGTVLSSHLINLGLADEISILIHPIIIGTKSYSHFSGLENIVTLTLKKSERFDNGCVWNVYKIKKTDSSSE